jgi:uncharacterized protein (DUF433 family)
MATIIEKHVSVDAEGVAWIDDTNVKVLEVALERMAHGNSAEEICDQHNGYLTLGQIHAALAHYYDHRAEYDELIERQLREFDTLHAASADSPARKRLRALGKIR